MKLFIFHDMSVSLLPGENVWILGVICYTLKYIVIFIVKICLFSTHSLECVREKLRIFSLINYVILDKSVNFSLHCLG